LQQKKTQGQEQKLKIEIIGTFFPLFIGAVLVNDRCVATATYSSGLDVRRLCAVRTLDVFP
jgi:hypothetical protein